MLDVHFCTCVYLTIKTKFVNLINLPLLLTCNEYLVNQKNKSNVNKNFMITYQASSTRVSFDTRCKLNFNLT